MLYSDVLSALTWWRASLVALTAWLAYAVVLAVERLCLSPIAGVPGPRLAALTQWYEFYYDIVLGGQFTFKIMELHRRYGDVVRIGPCEVHVADFAFHAHLYSTRPRDKWRFYTKQVRGAASGRLGRHGSMTAC